MKHISLVFILIVIAVIAMTSPFVSSATLITPEYQSKWQLYKTRFSKHYKSASEENYRFRLFISRLPENNANVRKLQQHNPFATFDPTLSPFSDWTQSELDRRRNKKLLAKNQQVKGERKTQLTALEQENLRKFMTLRTAEERSINWTARGAVTRVRNQNNCGSCYAFATCGGIEGQWFLSGHALVELSPQQLVSCDTEDYGCEGSDNYPYTEKWIVHDNNGTLSTWASDPYVSGDGVVPKCDENRHRRVVGASGIEGGRMIASHEEEINRVLVEEGPIQISIDSSVLEIYVGGIISGSACHPKNVDHEVLLTGVNNEHSPKYWIVKNSWGEDWGENGYFYLEKGSNQMCIADWPWMWKVRK